MQFLEQIGFLSGQLRKDIFILRFSRHTGSVASLREPGSALFQALVQILSGRGCIRLGVDHILKDQVGMGRMDFEVLRAMRETKQKKNTILLGIRY